MALNTGGFQNSCFTIAHGVLDSYGLILENVHIGEDAQLNGFRIMLRFRDGVPLTLGHNLQPMMTQARGMLHGLDIYMTHRELRSRANINPATLFRNKLDQALQGQGMVPFNLREDEWEEELHKPETPPPVTVPGQVQQTLLAWSEGKEIEVEFEGSKVILKLDSSKVDPLTLVHLAELILNVVPVVADDEVE